MPPMGEEGLKKSVEADVVICILFLANLFAM